MASAGRFLALLALPLGALLWHGCSVFPGRASVRVTPAPPPVASAANALLSLPNSDSRLPLILAQSGRFARANAVKFIALREAFWDFDTDTAVKLLRELREADGIPPFPLDGKWRTFSATIGIRDGAHEQGSAVFTVRGDGRELYASPVLRVGSRHEIRVDVAGVRRLELVAEGGEGHPHNSWAIWADPLVTR